MAAGLGRIVHSQHWPRHRNLRAAGGAGAVHLGPQSGLREGPWNKVRQRSGMVARRDSFDTM